MKVLEVNVDDVGLSGVFSLVYNVIMNTSSEISIDIACLAKFENPQHILDLKQHHSSVKYIGTEKSKFLRPFSYYHNLKKLLESEKYDCVHIHGDVSYLLYILGKASQDAGVNRIIFHSHAAGVDGRSRKIKRALHFAFRSKLKKIGTDFAACSDMAAEWMFPNVKKECVYYIKNGVDWNKFRFNNDTRENERKKLGVTNEFILGHVGRFAYQKNHKFLIDVYCKFQERHPDSKLLLIGEGPLQDQVREYAGTKNNKNIIFYGTSRNVNDLMQAMDVFTLPSWFEGLPIVGVEAQTSGLPVIFSDKITRQAAILDTTEFAPVDSEKDINIWVKLLEKIYQNRKFINRNVTISDRGFTLENTVKQFLGLYT